MGVGAHVLRLWMDGWATHVWTVIGMLSPESSCMAGISRTCLYECVGSCLLGLVSTAAGLERYEACTRYAYADNQPPWAPQIPKWSDNIVHTESASEIKTA